MKVKHLLTLIACILLPALVSAQSSAFEKASQLPDVKYIYLSKTMLSQLGDNDSIDNITFNLGDITKRLNSLELLTTGDSSSMEEIVPILKDMVKKMDLISQVKNNSVDINVYGTKDRGKEMYSKLMCYYQSSEANVLAAVYLTGEIDIDDIKDLMKKTTY